LAEPQRHWQHTLGEATAVRTRAQLGVRVKAAALGAPDELQHMAHWRSTLEHGRGAYLLRRRRVGTKPWHEGEKLELR
jgi:hypothetical protein